MVNKKKKLTTALSLAALVIPLLTLAQGLPQAEGGQIPAPQGGIVFTMEKITQVLNNILGIVWAGAVVFVVICFIMIGSYFLLTKGEPEKFREARNALVWAMVGVVVMVLSFSIVTAIANLVFSGVNNGGGK